jgi:hypothetical protein
LYSWALKKSGSSSFSWMGLCHSSIFCSHPPYRFNAIPAIAGEEGSLPGKKREWRRGSDEPLPKCASRMSHAREKTSVRVSPGFTVTFWHTALDCRWAEGSLTVDEDRKPSLTEGREPVELNSLQRASAWARSPGL